MACLALLASTYAAWTQDWTYDEAFHLEWSQRLLDSRISERESAERFNSKTPVMLLGVLARRAATTAGETEPRLLRLAARSPTLLWLALLLLAVFWTGRRLISAEAGHLATIVCALDPNLVAHGSLATVDVAYAAATLLTLAAGIGLMRAPTLARGLALGCALGLAFATKFSAILLLPGLALVALAMGVRQRTSPRLSAALGLAAATAWACLCAAYLFDRVGEPLASVTWHSAPFASLARWLPLLPLPTAFLTGLDLSFADERAAWNVYLFGRLFPSGVFYYFPVVWLQKTPIALLLATLVGLARGTARILDSPPLHALAANLGLTLGYFCLAFHAQIGFRFVLMCVPLGALLVAAGLHDLRRPWARAGALVLLALAVAENLPYLGNPLSFTNALVWPKHEAFRRLADSNLDWGQNRDKIDAWLAERAPGSRLDPVHPLLGHNTIGVNRLAGIWDPERYRFLRDNVEPGGHFGHTYVWFNVTESIYDRFMDTQRRLSPSADGAELCRAQSDFELLDPGGSHTLTITENPQPGETWLACVSTRRGTDFGMRVQEAGIIFGHWADGRCIGDLLSAGQIAWYRLTPGLHALCAIGQPNRRGYLDYRFEGRFSVRGHSAFLSLRHLDQPSREPEGTKASQRQAAPD